MLQADTELALHRALMPQDYTPLVYQQLRVPRGQAAPELSWLIKVYFFVGGIDRMAATEVLLRQIDSWDDRPYDCDLSELFREEVTRLHHVFDERKNSLVVLGLC